MAPTLRLLMIGGSAGDKVVVRNELERGGFNVRLERIETAEAMRAALQSREWDLIVSAVRIPGFSAPEALEVLHEAGLDLPLITLADAADEDAAVAAMRAGAHDYILKNEVKRFLPAIERELREASYRCARRKTEEQYRILFDANPLPMWVVDAETLRFLAVNEAAVRHYGYSRTEFLAMTALDIRPAEDVERARSIMARNTDGLENRGIWTHLKKDGTPMRVDVTKNGLAFHGRKAWLTLCVDVTDRARAEEALRRSEERFRSLIEGSRDLVAILDADGMIRYASPSAERTIGYRAEEVIGSSVFLHVHPEDSPRLEARIREILASEAPAEPVSFRLEHRDGSWRVFEGVGNNQVADPEVGGVVFNLRDVTDRQQAEESIQKLLHAVEQAQNIIFITDPDGRISYINPSFETVYGFKKEEVLGQTPRILKSGQYDAAFYEGFWQTILSGTPLRGEVVNRARDGRLVTVEAAVSSVVDPDGKRIGFIAVQNDITQRKLLEKEFLQAQKMEAVGLLAGGVAHDFNNLLTAILGYSDLLYGELADDPRLREEADEIRKAAHRAASLTRQLLAFSRKQILVPEVVSLNELVSQIQKMLRRLIGEDIDVAMALDPALGAVRADPGQIEQVLLNLAVNARDAMPRGGKLTIETSNVDLDEAYAQAHGARVPPGEYVLVGVSDTGVGMDEKTLGHAFEPFFTTKEKGKGTGLGLATVYGIVKQSGGFIWIYSEPGKGTTIKIYLPRVAAAGEEERIAATPQTAARGTETVLLVEDEDAVRALARRALEAVGYTVLEAPQAGEALAIAGRHPGTIHLMLTDTVMPGMGGPELAGRLAGLRPDTRVLFMSGYADDAVIRHGILETGSSFLQKPFTTSTLTRRVRDVLDRPGP